MLDSKQSARVHIAQSKFDASSIHICIPVLVTALVFRRLDNCNSVLDRMPKLTTASLHCVQSTAAKLICSVMAHVIKDIDAARTTLAACRTADQHSNCAFSCIWSRTQNTALPLPTFPTSSLRPPISHLVPEFAQLAVNVMNCCQPVSSW